MRTPSGSAIHISSRSPRLLLGRAHDLDTVLVQPGVFGVEVAHLQPQRGAARVRRIVAGHFEEPAAEKEHHGRVARVAELAVHREPERVPVEPSSAVEVGRA